jgi:hypothetical protein
MADRMIPVVGQPEINTGLVQKEQVRYTSPNLATVGTIIILETVTGVYAV